MTFEALCTASVNELSRSKNLKVISQPRCLVIIPMATVTADSRNDDMIKPVEYEAIASVIRQCDNGSSTLSHESSLANRTALSSNAVNNPKPSSADKNRSTSRGCTMNPEQLCLYRLKIRCNSCGKFGYFASDHNAIGSVKNGLPSNDALLATDNNRHKAGNNIGVLDFGIVSPAPAHGPSKSVSHIVSTFSTNQNPPTFGPIVDGGAPYSAIGATELCVLRSSLSLSRLKRYDPPPSSFAEYKFWKYEDGTHSSEECPILGSVSLTFRSDLGRSVDIRQLVIAGSSQ